MNQPAPNNHPPASSHTKRSYLDVACSKEERKTLYDTQSRALYRNTIENLKMTAPRSLALARNYLDLATLLGNGPDCEQEQDECFQQCRSILHSCPLRSYLFDPTLVQNFDPEKTGRFCYDLGVAYGRVGKLHDALWSLKNAIDLLRKSGHSSSDELSRIHCSMAQIFLQQDEFGGAMSQYFSAVASASRMTPELATVFHEITLRDTLCHEEEIQRCCGFTIFMIERLSLSARNQDSGRVNCMWGIACYKLGKLEDSRLHIQNAIRFLEEHAEEAKDLWRIHHVMAQISLQQKALDDSVTHFKRAMEIAESANLMSDLATTLQGMALAFHNQGEYDQAVCCARRALDIQVRHDSTPRRKLAQCYRVLGLLFESQGKCFQAVMCYLQAVKHCESLGHMDLDTYTSLGRTAALAMRQS